MLTIAQCANAVFCTNYQICCASNLELLQLQKNNKYNLCFFRLDIYFFIFGYCDALMGSEFVFVRKIFFKNDKNLLGLKLNVEISKHCKKELLL